MEPVKWEPEKKLWWRHKCYAHIYRVTCKTTGRVYIGKTSSENPLQRWYQHKRDARLGSASRFHAAIREHGEDNFVCEIIACALGRDNLKPLETALIEQYDADNTGLNTEGPSAWRKRSESRIEAQMLLWSALNRAGHEAVIAALKTLAA
jgi:group I intron endonuclease